MCESKLYTLCVVTCVAIILILVVVLVLCLTLRTKPPTYTIVGFSIPVSNNAQIQNGTFKFYLTVKNGNKVSPVYHDDIKLTFDYNQDVLGNTTLPSFRQKYSATSRFVEEVNANPRVQKAIVNAIAINKTAQVKVDLVTRGSWPVRSHMSMSWKHLQGVLSIGSDGKTPSKKKTKLKHVPKKQISWDY